MEFPEGLMTVSSKGTGGGSGVLAGLLNFLGAEGLAVGAVAADFGADEGDLEAEGFFDFFADAGERVAEVFFHFAAAETDDVSVFALHARFVVVLVAVFVQEIEFVDEARFLEHFESAVDCDAIELGVGLASLEIESFGVEVLAALIDEIEQDLALPGEADALLLECARHFHRSILIFT